MKLRIYNSTLDPNLWNEDKTLKPEIRDALLKIADDFYKSTDLTGDIHNILFLGSSANYNWNPSSDIDIHIVVDIAEEKINEEYARKFMDALSFKWNTEHDIEIKGHPVEVYLQDIREPNSNANQARKDAAIYSLFDGKWILEPQKYNIPLDTKKIKTKFDTICKKIDKVIESNDIDKLKELMKSIRNYRNAGLSKGGEFSVENLVFKLLRYSGYLKKLKDSIGSIYDKKRSLPEDGNVAAHKKTEPLNENEVRNYLILGVVNSDLEIISHKDFFGVHTHEWMSNRNGHFQKDESAVCWRYKSKNNTLYWSSEPTDKQRFAVVEYLKVKCNIQGDINTIRQQYDTEVDGHGIFLSHFVNEAIKKDYLIVGTVSGGLDVDGKYDYIGTKSNGIYNVCHPRDTMGVCWRYKSSNNTIYWRPDERPNEKQRDAVLLWLDKKGIKNPQSLYLNSDDYFASSHRIGESLDNINRNFIVVGIINQDLEILTQKDYVGGENVNHEKLLKSNPIYKTGEHHQYVLWRYKTSNNTIYWSDPPNGVQKQSVKDWLHDKCGVNNPHDYDGNGYPNSLNIN